MTAGPTLTTDRLILKPKGVEDFEELCALWADADFTRFIMGHALSAEDVWYRLLRDMGHWAALGHGNWTIRLKDGGDYVGSVGVLDFRREVEPALNAPELGWGIAPRFQGQGLASEALQAALQWADRALKASRTVCMIAPDNAPSIRLAQRVGYAPYADTTYKGAAVTLFQRPLAA